MTGVKVVHLTSAHKVDDVRILHKQCRSLADAGYEVVLIAATHTGPDIEIDGVTIRGVLGTKRTRLFRIIVTTISIFRKAVKENASVYQLHDPELLPIGLLLRLQRRKVIYDAHENFSGQLLTKTWIPAPLRGVVSKLGGAFEYLASRLLSGVVVANPAHAKPFPKRRTVVVQNFPMLSELAGCTATPYADRPPIVSYVGSLTTIRGVEEMVQAIGLVPPETEAHLHLGGEFEPAHLVQTVAKLPGWHRTIHEGWVDRHQLVSLLDQSRVGLVVVHPVPNYLENQPVKLFEYMLAGIPVIASNFPNYRQFISDIGGGLMVDPLNPHEIADAISWLLQHPEEAEVMGQKGRSVVLSAYNWEQESQKLVEFYRMRIVA